MICCSFKVLYSVNKVFIVSYRFLKCRPTLTNSDFVVGEKVIGLHGIHSHDNITKMNFCDLFS